MLYYEFDEVRIEWNGNRTCNVQIQLENGKWTDVHCTENHDMDHNNMNEVYSWMLEVYSDYIEEDNSEDEDDDNLPPVQTYTGWFETENGAFHFSKRAAGLVSLYLALSFFDKHNDFGHTDMEVYDEEGNDVTKTVYTMVSSITHSNEYAKRYARNDDT